VLKFLSISQGGGGSSFGVMTQGSTASRRLSAILAGRRGRRWRHQRLQAGGQDGRLPGCAGGGAAPRLGRLSVGAFGDGEHHGRRSARSRADVLEQQPGARLILVMCLIRQAGRSGRQARWIRQAARLRGLCCSAVPPGTRVLVWSLNSLLFRE